VVEKTALNRIIKNDRKIAIIGSGMAGLGAAYRFRCEGVFPVLYDKNPYPGGHTASWTNSHGFTFDEGPHISFTRDTRIQELFAESVNSEYVSARAIMNNYWQGHWIKHPVQCNLYGLPQDLVDRVIRDFKYAIDKPEKSEFRNYSDWLIAAYGKTFAETFPMEYGSRYHTTSADNMSTDWLGPRLYRPSLEEVLAGAESPHTEDVHYITDFRYPLNNGFASYLTRFIKDATCHLNSRVVTIDTRRRTLAFNNGDVKPYDYLVSSMPLPDLISAIQDVPADVLEASQVLAASKCVLVNVGIDREDVSDAHVSYFYDRDFVFTRLSFPHMQSPNNVPPGYGSIQAELYFSDKYKPLERQPDEYIQPVLDDLLRCGLIRESDRVITAESRLIRYANIIYDLDRAAALAVVQGYLAGIDVQCCGRYGEWGYHWTDESFKSGESAAQNILDAM
jgi:protoporphyrinogen oxidase